MLLDKGSTLEGVNLTELWCFSNNFIIKSVPERFDRTSYNSEAGDVNVQGQSLPDQHIVCSSRGVARWKRNKIYILNTSPQLLAKFMVSLTGLNSCIVTWWSSARIRFDPAGIFNITHWRDERRYYANREIYQLHETYERFIIIDFSLNQCYRKV